jgi:hypothetical protein
MPLGPNDVPFYEIDAAKEFIRKPLSEGFNAWKTLRDHDYVNMRLDELAKLMAWYAKLQMLKAAHNVQVPPAAEIGPGAPRALPAEV